MFKNLTPRSVAALTVVAVSFFLMVCVARYGGGFADAHAAQTAGPLARLSGWLVQNVGAGIWVLLLLPMAWGVVVYFDERTPELVMRFVGTLLLALAVSTIAGLLHAGVWSGHIGEKVAGTLGGAGTVLAWLLVLPLFLVSLIFATDWMFHSLRRDGRTAAAGETPIAEEPAVAELLEHPAQSEPRAFVVETPRAAIAAAEMEDIVEETSAEATTPQGWDETEDDGRTVISSPGGYRGVEFLPQSDELAVPEVRLPPRTQYFEPAAAAPDAALFHDDEFVATSEAAFFVETPSDASEEDTQEISPAEASSEPSAEEEEIEDAVQALFEAVTTPSPVEAAPAEPVPVEAAPASGIGLPEDSPFADEFFPTDGGWPYATETAAAASDGASAANEMASTYMPAAPAPEPITEETEPVVEDEPVAMDEILVSRLPEQVFEDSVSVETAPAEEPSQESGEVVLEEPVAEVAAPAAPILYVPEPQPQLTLFTEPVAAASTATVEAPAAASAVATLPELDLTRLHSMELDPLFHDAMNAVLERGRASAVVLQRQLGIGYARGIRILDQMTAAGLTGPDTPTGSRELRVTREAWTAFSA
jgi:hypothetical protein